MKHFFILQKSLRGKLWYLQIRNKSFKDTLNNPKFPISMRKNASLNSKFEECWNSAYKNNLNLSKETKAYILHDGPPYANGNPHMGHALNKILKDITVRYKILQGYRVDYRPGWDCHGLPIEMKALGLNPSRSEPIVTRNKARAVAEKYIDIQGKAFQSWGVMGDWSHTYRSMDYKYQAAQLAAFANLNQNGLVTRGLYPVHWSYSSRTALAEAELEYNENHKSHSIHVAFKVSRLSIGLQSKLDSRSLSELYFVIWTTTPWTLISNEAVAVDSNTIYHLCYCTKKKTNFVCSSAFVEKLELFLGSSLERVAKFPGEVLLDSRYEHPLIPGKDCPVLAGSHVTSDKGTGLVHVAPCHGREDFELGQKMNLPLNLALDDRAVYTSVAGPDLEGVFAITDGSQKIIDLLGSHVLHSDHIIHSYPYDWRSKKPVITLTSNQWFLNTALMKEKALAAYEPVEVFPPSLKPSMDSFLTGRSRWCISRQRTWGVPIPVFFHAGEPILDNEFILSIADRVAKEGSDFWWKTPLNEFIPDSIRSRLNLNDNKLEKSSDIFDIWMDSGLTWYHVLGESQCADLYIEGQDQFRGWFSSSLLLCSALTGKSPYKRLAVHGFTTDESGLKMSKSLGNVVAPDDVISKHGVDVLRFWATSAGLGRSSVGDTMLGYMAEKYRALRNMFRFMLGNLSDFEASTATTPGLSIDQLQPIDRYLLHRVAEFMINATDWYEKFEYDQVLPQMEILAANVSKLYFTAIKDRLYCDPENSQSRLSAQTALHIALSWITLGLAPVLPHLTEEVHAASTVAASSLLVDRAGRWGEEAGVTWASCLDPRLAAAVETGVSPVRTALSSAPELEDLRAVSGGTNPLVRLAVELTPSSEEGYQQFQILQTEETSSTSSLCELLRCASVTLLPPSQLQHTSTDASSATYSGSGFHLRATLLSADCHCPRCRRYTMSESSQEELCLRCSEVVAAHQPNKISM